MDELPRGHPKSKNKIAVRSVSFLALISGKETALYAVAPCHIAGIFRPLQGCRHFKLKIHDDAYNCILRVGGGWGTHAHISRVFCLEPRIVHTTTPRY